MVHPRDSVDCGPRHTQVGRVCGMRCPRITARSTPRTRTLFPFRISLSSIFFWFASDNFQTVDGGDDDDDADDADVREMDFTFHRLPASTALPHTHIIITHIHTHTYTAMPSSHSISGAFHFNTLPHTHTHTRTQREVEFRCSYLLSGTHR